MARALIYATGDIVPLVPILSESGNAVVEAYDSVEVVKLLLRGHFDLVWIPDGAEPTDADELLPLVRRLTDATLVVAGDGDDLAISMALMQGADHYLKLPDDINVIRSRLGAILRRHRVQRGTPGDR